MRPALLLALLPLTALPAAGADSIADQASRAYGIFAGNQAQPDFLGARYGEALFRGVAGDWVSLNGPAPNTGVETYGADTEKSCRGTGVLTLAAPDRLTLTLAARPTDKGFTQTYTLIAGATFAERTDPAEYLAAIGLGPDKSGPQIEARRALALSLANGTVQIFRPSPDILVILRDKAYPTVLARCPAS